MSQQSQTPAVNTVAEAPLPEANAAETAQAADPSVAEDKAESVAPAVKAAGFAAAPVQADFKEKDRLAMQFALDSKTVPHTSTTPTQNTAAYIPGTSPYAQKASLGPVAPGSYDTSGYKYTPIQLAPVAEAEKADTTPAPVVVPVAKAVSEEDNKSCLDRLAAVFELAEIQHRALLRNLALVQDIGPYTLPNDRDAAVVKTTTNTAIAAKGLIEFQETSPMKAADALEGALLVLNDKASYPNGVELTGNMRDRYMLTLAAQKLNLQVTNPVKASDLDADTRHAIEAEFFLHVVEKNDALKTVSDTQEKAKVDLTRDITRANDLVTGKADPAPAPQTAKTVKAPAPAMV